MQCGLMALALPLTLSRGAGVIDEPGVTQRWSTPEVLPRATQSHAGGGSERARRRSDAPANVRNSQTYTRTPAAASTRSAHTKL